MKSIIYISILIVTFFTSIAIAQDGEALFKSKCNVCHMLGSDGTGPNLKDVRQKWKDADEADLIYEWVTNPEELINSGKSEMALKADDYSVTKMTAQDISKEQTDAILDYIDNYVEPVKEVEQIAVSPESPTVIIVPNYKKNLKLFYILSIVLLIQIIVIINFSSTIKEFMKRNINNKTNIIVSVITGGLALINPFQSNALSFVSYGKGEADGPWLLVENSDLYILAAANIIILLGILYLYRLFTNFHKLVKPQYFVRKKVVAEKSKRSVLTDAVPVEEEESIVMHHEYDGIRELDNNLPPWWVWMFYATIIFAVVYIFNYHILGTGDLQITEYEKSMSEAEIEVNAYKEKMGMQIDETNATLLTDPSELAIGKKLFDANCVVCHNPNGEGNIGPNLTDKSWIYGYEIGDVFGTIIYGTNNGMPEHGSKFNPIEIQQVSSYVLSLPEFKGGKDAEGTIIKE